MNPDLLVTIPPEKKGLGWGDVTIMFAGEQLETRSEVTLHAPGLIGLVGFDGVGKDEAAAALRTAGWVRSAFGDVMKDFLRWLDPLVRSIKLEHPVHLSELLSTHGWEGAKREFPYLRRLLRDTGMAGRFQIGAFVWVDAWRRGRRSRAFNTDAPEVVSDVRFMNEADTILAEGGVLVGINRPGCVARGHLEQQDRIDLHYVIENDGTVEELDAAIRAIAAEVQAPGYVKPRADKRLRGA